MAGGTRQYIENITNSWMMRFRVLALSAPILIANTRMSEKVSVIDMLKSLVLKEIYKNDTSICKCKQSV